MRTAAIALLLSCTGCASLDRQDAVWIAGHLVDVGQTVTIARIGGHSPTSPCVAVESNPVTRRLIGREPEVADVYKWGVAWAALRFGTFWAAEKLGASDRALKRAKSVANVVTWGNAYQNHRKGVRAWSHNRYSCSAYRE